MKPKIPQKFGRYKVIREIAQGSPGVAVCLGHDPFLNRPVALKVACLSDLKEKEAACYQRRFFNEASTASRLQHPHLLRIYDAGMEGNVCYIVMEYIPGGETLRPYCRPGNLLPVAQAARIINDCALALDYTHRQGVVHRDIKPSNLLLNEAMEIKVADFGIAQTDDGDASEAPVGSPRYMSPEQVQEASVGQQTDFFSLGVVMYELLTGRHPFSEDNLSRFVDKLLTEDPPPLGMFRTGLPRGLEEVVSRALQKDPKKRYQTGQDLASDLAECFSFLDHPRMDRVTKERFHRLKRLDFFQDFSDAELREVLRASPWQVHAAGEEIVSEGEADDAVYVLTAGRASVKKAGVVLATLTEGDCFGEIGYVTKFKWPASLVASTTVSLIKLSSALTKRVSMDCQLRLCMASLRTLVERFSMSDEMGAVSQSAVKYQPTPL